jgi:hypothetical protein
MTRQELADSLNYIEERTSFDVSLKSCGVRRLEEVFMALRAASEGDIWSPACRRRVASAYEKARVEIPADNLQAPNGWATAIVRTAREFLEEG